MRRWTSAMVLMWGLAGLPGCGDGTGPIPALRDLAAAQRRWRDHGYPNYRYRLQVSCFCGDVSRPVEISVVEGAVAVYYLDTGLPADTLWFGRYATMERLFATIADAASNDGATLNAEYDPVLGYPRHASLDPVPNAVDDEFSVTVTNVLPVYIR